jgi:putative flippase GtrA
MKPKNNLLRIEDTRRHAQLLRYGCVVAIAMPVDVGILYVLTSLLHIHYIVSATLAFSISMLVNYTLSKRWVFINKSGRSDSLNLVAFSIIGFIGLGLTDTIIWLLSGRLGMNYMAAKAVALCIVFMWSFGARSFLFEGRSFLNSTSI